jgi:hypothetical protein
MRRTLIIAGALVIAVFSAFWLFGYSTRQFKGGLGIRDSGFFSYPRYYARIGQFPLWKPGEYQFTVRGLPSDPLDLSLHVLDVTDEDRAQMAALLTSVEVSVTDSFGNPVCACGGRLNGGWVFLSGPERTLFRHYRCRDLPISRSVTYVVKVALAKIDARSPHRTVELIMTGGGNELP